MSNATATKTIPASKKAIMAVLADFGNISAWASNIPSSQWIGDTRKGVGMARESDIGRGQSIKERVVELSGSQMVIDIYETNAKFTDAVGVWKLGAKTADGIPVTFTMDYAMKGGFVGTLLDKVVVNKKFNESVATLVGDLRDAVHAADKKATKKATKPGTKKTAAKQATKRTAKGAPAKKAAKKQTAENGPAKGAAKKTPTKKAAAKSTTKGSAKVVGKKPAKKAVKSTRKVPKPVSKKVVAKPAPASAKKGTTKSAKKPTKKAAKKTVKA